MVIPLTVKGLLKFNLSKGIKVKASLQQHTTAELEIRISKKFVTNQRNALFHKFVMKV